MKTAFLTLLLLAAPAYAFAQSAEPAPAQEASGQQDARPNNDAQANLDARRDCIRYTGTRIVQRADKVRADEADQAGELDRDGCTAAAGRVYSQRDLRSTGQVNVAEALRMLDPAIY